MTMADDVLELDGATDDGAQTTETTTKAGATTNVDPDAALFDNAGDKADAVSEAVAGTWREDWREALAGDDAKYLARLKRYASFDNYAKAQRALEQKIGSGEFKRDVPFPADGTDDDKAAWRKERGLPDAAEGYVVPEIKGHQWTEEDKPAMQALFNRLHGVNAPQAVVDEALGFYAETIAQAKEAQSEANKQFRAEAEDTLRSEFGNDYRQHMTLYKRTLEDKELFPGDSGEWLAKATVDGKRLINHPDIAKALIAIGLERFGAGGLVTGGEMSRMTSRLDEIKKVLKEDPSRYFREKLDVEMMELRRQEEKYAPRR
jgi:hypothetical protein